LLWAVARYEIRVEKSGARSAVLKEGRSRLTSSEQKLFISFLNVSEKKLSEARQREKSREVAASI
jgi:hypothetical protein